MEFHETADLLRSGNIGIIPTDTIYGIVASAMDKDAVERVYRVRGRDEGKPCIVLIADVADIDQFQIPLSGKATKSLDFLPKKKYVLFLIGMVVALELGIRVADWHVFSGSGSMKYSLGTPGRYFLPNLEAQIILIATGLGALLHHF